jgi:molybdate transport repressor ModE-like protein
MAWFRPFGRPLVSKAVVRGRPDRPKSSLLRSVHDKNTTSIELRVVLDPETFLGPGKADLLQAIEETGSIAAAGRRMGMSYKRAWYLIDTMNTYFHEPMVVSVKGGNTRGGASLLQCRVGLSAQPSVR